MFNWRKSDEFHFGNDIYVYNTYNSVSQWSINVPSLLLERKSKTNKQTNNQTTLTTDFEKQSENKLTIIGQNLFVIRIEIALSGWRKREREHVCACV